MANPIFIPIQFAANGIKNIIQKTLQSGQDAQDATWSAGWSGRTMIPIEAGGLAPKGQDFNGVLYVLSDAAFHRQGGKEIQFNPLVVSELGGYDEGAIIQADNFSCHYRSLIPNNTTNPNTEAILGKWMIYSGQGSVYPASSTVSGMMKVLDVLTSKDAFSALSANMGRVLNEKIDSFAHPVAMAKCVRVDAGSDVVYKVVSGFNIKSVVGRRFPGSGFEVGRLVVNFDNPMKNENYIIQATTTMAPGVFATSSVTVENKNGWEFPPTVDNFGLSFHYRAGGSESAYYFPTMFYIVVYP